MTDITYRYNHSKHIRRIKSRQKKCQKLCTKYENVYKSKQIKTKEKLYVSHKKSLREIQRKQWSKYNKKSKPRNRINKLYYIDGYDSATMTYSDSSSDDEDYDSSYDKQIIQNINGLCIKKRFGEIDYYSCAILKSKLKNILSKHFGSYECKYIPFDMNTFYGQCCFWYYIMDKLGIIKELFHTKYLVKCDKDWSSKISYYIGFVDAITLNMITTQHILYILDEIDFMVDDAFDNDFLYHSKHVVMNKNILINLLDMNNSEDIGIDLCLLIADFTMSNKDDILFHYEKKKTSKIKTSKYHIGTHKVIEKYVENKEEYDTEVIYKVFDGKDITDYYKKCDKMWSDSLPMFHYGKDRYTFDNILKIVWYKFKEYYHQQKLNNFEIKYNVIYMMLLYYVDNCVVCKNIDCSLNGDTDDITIWKQCFAATKKQCVLHNILMIINKAVKIWCIEETKKKHNLYYIFSKNFFDKISSENISDTQQFCGLMMQNCYFSHSFFVNDFFKNKDHHKQHKDLWINIWKKIPMNTGNIKLENVYKLTVFHCDKYKKFCKTHSEYGGAYKAGRTIWGCHKMNKFDITEFILDDIIPIILHILNIDYDKVLILNMLNRKRLLSYNMFIKSVKHIVQILDNEQCKNSAQNMVHIDEYVNDKFSRNYVSKKMNLKKKHLRVKYFKYGVKCSDKRIEKKLRKYKTNFLFF
eukprot:211879_1